MSAITRGKLADFSLERLMTLVNRLGMDIEIVVTAHDVSVRSGHMIVRSSDNVLTTGGARH